MNLVSLGWRAFFESAFALHAGSGMVPARVYAQHRGAYEVYAEKGAFTAEVSGRFRHEAVAAADFPVVGDWVAIEARAAEGKATIHATLPRQTSFSRTAAGDATKEQVLAANIDDIFIVASLTTGRNLRRIERYLSLAWESGAQPALLLTKADLCEESAKAAEEARRIASGCPVFAVSSLTGQGMERLREMLRPGRTVALLGPSGVGKSTLINYLAGVNRQAVQEVREEDQKGRHTTTQRELICLPDGGLIIDTPGLRELQVWDSETGISEAFADIERLAAECRFADCQHEREPDCAVLKALAEGELDPARLENHRKLRREQAYFERRQNVRAQTEEKRRWKTISKSLRAREKLGD